MFSETVPDHWVGLVLMFVLWGDPLEKGMATHSSILAWRIPQTD